VRVHVRQAGVLDGLLHLHPARRFRGALGIVATNARQACCPMTSDERKACLSAATLIELTMHAHQRGDQAWLERHRWFGEACERLFVKRGAHAKKHVEGMLPKRFHQVGWTT
jgi:hypothetical protein